MPLQLDDVRLQQYGSDFLRIRHANSVRLAQGIAYQSVESAELVELVFLLLGRVGRRREVVGAGRMEKSLWLYWNGLEGGIRTILRNW